MYDFRLKLRKNNFRRLRKNWGKIQNFDADVCAGDYAEPNKKLELSSFKTLSEEEFENFLIYNFQDQN